MATYRGGEIPVPDYEEENLRLRGGRAPGMENVEEELNLPEDQRLDHIRRPGEKGYMQEQHIAGERTHDGYPLRQNPDGSQSSEVSITVTDPRLNGGQPTNIPSLWGGQEVDEDLAVEYALRSGKMWPAHTSIPDAERSAIARSDTGGASVPDMMQNFNQGGMVQPGCKHGSSTVVQCSNKFR